MRELKGFGTKFSKNSGRKEQNCGKQSAGVKPEDSGFIDISFKVCFQMTVGKRKRRKIVCRLVLTSERAKWNIPELVQISIGTDTPENRYAPGPIWHLACRREEHLVVDSFFSNFFFN